MYLANHCILRKTKFHERTNFINQRLFTCEGTIANNGEVTNNGKIEVADNGDIHNDGTIANNGEVTNNGKIEVTDKGNIQNEGTIANNGEVTNNGKIEVTDKGNIQNEGTIANNGNVTNNGKIEVANKGEIQNEGTIANNGNVTNNGKVEVTNKGEIHNEGTIANNGEVTNNGKVEVTDNGDIHNEGTIANNGEVTNNGKIEVTDKGNIQNEGTIANNGNVTNNGKIEVTDNGEIQNSGTIDGSNTIEGNGQIFHAVTYINYDPDKDPKDLVKNVLQDKPIPLDVLTSQFSVFEGWYDKQENGQVVSAETLVTGPITIYAYWNDYKITTVTQPTTLSGTSGTELSPGYDLSTLLASDSYTTDITYSWADPDAEHYGLEIQTDSYGKYWLRGIPNKSTNSGDQIAISISSPHCRLAPVITIPVNIMSKPVYYPVYYEVTIPKVEGVRTIPSAGTHYYKEGSSISLTLILDPEYDLSTPVVKVNDNTIKPNSNGRYSIAVYSDLNFSIDSVKPNISVGIDKVVSTKSRIYAIDGMIHIDITTPQDVFVVTFDGRLVRRVSLPAGNNCLQALPSGFYIVKLSDGTIVKIRNN